MAKIDKDAVQQRFDRLTEIFSGMVKHADELSQRRCPYRDRHDLCTAAFSCRNQQPGADRAAPPACNHDGRFDYRDAWESKPESRERAKRKIEGIKTAAQKRRAEKAGRGTAE